MDVDVDGAGPSDDAGARVLLWGPRAVEECPQHHVGAATAIVVGLVAVTPAAGFISPMSAIVLGAIAAVPSYLCLVWRARTALDDSLDVVAAHGVGGTVGALLTGVSRSRASTALPTACSMETRTSSSSRPRQSSAFSSTAALPASCC